MSASQRPSGSYFRPNSPLGWAAVAATAASFALGLWSVAVSYGEPFRSIAPAGAAGALALASAVIAIVNGDRNLSTLLLTFFWGFVFFVLAVGSM